MADVGTSPMSSLASGLAIDSLSDDNDNNNNNDNVAVVDIL